MPFYWQDVKVRDVPMPFYTTCESTSCPTATLLVRGERTSRPKAIILVRCERTSRPNAILHAKFLIMKRDNVILIVVFESMIPLSPLYP